MALVVALLLLPATALADTTIGFDDLAPGTSVTNQYEGQGVVFGPLPGGAGNSLSRPIVENMDGQAQSLPNVADITCFSCNENIGSPPDTTGTFTVQRSRVSVYVGYLGPTKFACAPDSTASYCAVVQLLAFDSSGNQIAASAPTTVAEGNGVHTLLSVSTPSPEIVGFEVVDTRSTDNDKDVAIDDLTFDTPASTSPDFTLSASSGTVTVVQGSSATDTIEIGRISGSTGNIALGVSGLPAGVHASLVPNPADGTQSMLTLTADPDAPATSGAYPTFTVTGTPQAPSAGSSPRSLTLHVGVQPAFTVRILGSTSIDLAACTLKMPVVVGRAASFPGPVSLSITGLPAGVQASLDPTDITFPNGTLSQTATLTLTTPETGNTIIPRTATIHATAAPFAEETATFSVGGTCALKFDPEVLSMQITQGTQLPVLPIRDPSNPGAPIPYTRIGLSAAAGTQQALSQLAAFKPTVVRVYADLRYGPAAGVQVPAVLKGFAYDNSGGLVPLPGGPITPVSSPGNLTTGLLAQFGATFLQNHYVGVYTFVLPSSWERGKIELEADLLPAQTWPPPPSRVAAPAHSPVARIAALPGQQQWAPCTTAACLIDNKLTISQIPFKYTFSVTIRPVAMIQTNPYDATLPDPDTVFQWARVVTPIPLIVEPYAGTIDIGDLIGKDNSTGAVTIALDNKMLNYVCDNGEPAHGWDVGVEHNDIRSAQNTGYCWQGFPVPVKTYHDSAFVNSPSPLGSVAHELFHLLGRPHASAGCGAAIGISGTGTQPAESWPLDERGYLQSVGLAPAPTGFGFPYEVIPSAGTQWYDFMSYCASGGDGDPLGFGQNRWVSVHNWNAVLDNFGYYASADAARSSPSKARAAASAVASLQITASVDQNRHVTIVSVNPVAASPEAPSSSPYHLTASDSAGHVLTDVPMFESFGHIDGRAAQGTLTLAAVVPAAGVDSVAVVSNGATLATRRRTPSAPTVSTPRRPTFGARNAVIRWHAADRDGDPLAIEVDYSGEPGRTWAPIWMGPNTGRALVPDRYLFRSAHARLRVVANDGFQTATAVSRRFRSPGAPPFVRILLPWSGTREPNDAPLVLSGQAFDDRSRLLTGRHLRWMLGRRLLGTGAQFTTSGLPPGRRRIDLVATDRLGRSTRASVYVRLRAARPLFLVLSAPRKLKRTARTVRLTVASSLAATLTVRIAGLRPQRFAIGRRIERVTLRVRRARKPLHLRLSLSAGGLGRTVLVTVRRA